MEKTGHQTYSMGLAEVLFEIMCTRAILTYGRSWLIDSYLPALSDHTLANEDFYEDAEREIPDCMITAFRSGTWSQISRFADLRNAIANSFTRRVQNVCNGYMRGRYHNLSISEGAPLTSHS